MLVMKVPAVYPRIACGTLADRPWRALGKGGGNFPVRLAYGTALWLRGYIYGALARYIYYGYWVKCR